MNSSSFSNMSSSLIYRDALSIAVTKNVLIVALGITINYINGALIHTFRKHEIFFMNPRYILFIHLVVNDMIQLTTSISLFVLSYVFYRISTSLCCFIVTFVVFTSVNSPLNLALMAVECYIAVCFPLRHAELCTIKRTYFLIGCIWSLSATTVLPDIFLIFATEPLWLFNSTVFCDRDTVFRHPISIKKRDVSYIIFLSGVWLTLLFTYVRIFCAAQAANSAEGMAKARNTILIHGFQLLLCMLTYATPLARTFLAFLSTAQYVQAYFFWYILIQILPRFVSPIVYGVRDNTFRQYLKKYLLRSIREANKLHP
ncbi:PREDICTED: olfactory receptor 51B2-like [Poecilia mexicana]|uniref:olfactory receptor 51B2-like n=1 Tax=Poecilia mexicana TaxID=48701 RepID=UPI00072E5967|nr:PREDICTED: olfactory receptor 51B2-like [Poecilia mexicana]